MDGIGSGRQRCWFAGGSIDDYLSIDVRHWKREGLLTPSLEPGTLESRKAMRKMSSAYTS